jgi:4-amino-4-deoxy-L-arabinose transferase-like glycosyltransferase
MTSSSSPQRFGLAQIYAGLLLLLFIGQALYLAVRTPLSGLEIQFLHPRGMSAAGSPAAQFSPAPRLPRSPVTELMAGVFFTLQPLDWLARVPFVMVGALLGASLWYIARRLYGNKGGLIALALYAFSPAMITYSARVQPEIVAAWGAFGAIFTGIAVAHTLYAPREVLLWNWRRILLLGIALGIAVGAQIPALIALPLSVGFMLYLVPARRGPALAIGAAASACAFLFLALLYRLRLAEFAAAARALAAFTPSVLVRWTTWRLVGLFFFRNGPGFLLLLGLAIAAYLAWPRTRFFGNSAPLLSVGVVLLAGLGLPHVAGLSFLIVALPLMFVFIAGVCADLLESRLSSLMLGLILAVLLAHASFSLLGLIRLRI